MAQPLKVCTALAEDLSSVLTDSQACVTPASEGSDASDLTGPRHSCAHTHTDLKNAHINN